MSKFALITGASSGLGYELTKVFSSRGIQSLMIARNEEKLSVACEKINKEFGIKNICIAADVSTEDGGSKIRNLVSGEKIAVKWLVNNAGIGKFGKLEDFTFSDVQGVISSNLTGTILLTKLFLLDVIGNEGVVCNIMSTAAQGYKKNEAIYSAAKWGVKGFTETLRVEVKGLPVKVFAVYPGGMNTPFWEKNKHHVPDSTSFMDPSVVAKIIVTNILDVQGCQISDITINRV